MPKTIQRLLPGGALLLALAVLLHVTSWRESIPLLLPFYYYVVFGAGILLGWRFDRSRIVLALLIIALSERAFVYGSATTLKAVSVLLPLNLAALAWLKERGLFTSRGWMKIIILAIQAGLIIGLSRPELAPVRPWLDFVFIKSSLLTAAKVPQPALAACALALWLVFIRFLRYPTILEGGELWALIAVLVALFTDDLTRRGLYFTTSGLILVVSLVEASYGMAFIDDLTGLPGRRALNEELMKLGGRYAIAMVDIDHFKRFNDEHGHDVGDGLLRMIGAKLAGINGGGQAFRYGGEEFAVIFPNKNREEAEPFLETLRARIANAQFFVRTKYRPRNKLEQAPAVVGRKKICVTVSIGVASAGANHTSPDQVIKAADSALYRAKKTGRNRLCAWKVESDRRHPRNGEKGLGS